MFHLAISSLLNDINEPLDQDNSDLSSYDLQELKKAALDDSEYDSSSISERKVTVRRRALAVKTYALARSNGVCEACDNPAPFLNSSNAPYLEVHHLRRLTDGGLDHPEHVAAICPNCHRRVHHGINSKEYNDKLIEKIKLKENDLYT